ncbi:ABC transporter ATP-binding protein [Longispora fulva]|uniref:Putative ABC transport system ATP-binding protein n=1 Tax=Longispora fulva TaxID=619741 RepID=A0A8J7KIN7_9ACTN|nr:ABC transporter ATP-binding protein [Longispora fulva]MBG6136249.1 putative ABC transport system ATP-binding protein [Longispora fulva]GIG63431.1 ABC transporter ATP-binding protein [Longispora fulva]
MAGSRYRPAPEPGVVLQADRLYRFFHTGGEEVLALSGVSLRLAAGERVVVAGESGSGKSTLLACLAGLDEPDGGVVHVAGHRLTGRTEAERARLRAAHLGMVYQYGNLLEHLTVARNIAFVRTLAGRRPVDVSDLLESVGLAGRGGAYPAELSGGQAARAGLAVALANDPEVLIADEPTGELDADTEERVLGLLTARAARGIAVLVASHSPVIARTADRVLTLRDGQEVR